MMARDGAVALARGDGLARPRGDGATSDGSTNDAEVRDQAVRELEDFLASWCDDDSELAPIARHVLAVPGKRVRGRLTLACAWLAGTADRDAVRAAAAVELLHEASLVHDDICDRSLVRRGAPSVAAAFGMRVAARLGIWLAARGLALIGELEVRRGLGLAFGPLSALAEGQLLEIARSGTSAGSSAAERRDHYLAVVRAKTGALMRMACDVGGRLAGLAQLELDALAAFAEAFGTAFQVRDDIRDLEAPASLGKPGGNDVTNGVWTWPVLEWLGERPDADARALAVRPLDEVRAELEASGALPRARAFAAAQVTRAWRALLGVPDVPGRAWLVELSEIAA
jgi:geranylgeranyl pyrophosphate synthase